MKVVLVTIVCAASCLVGGSVLAQLVPSGDAFLVSTEDTVDQFIESRRSPEVAMDAEGRFVVAWAFYPATFVARSFAADGTAGEEFVIAERVDPGVPAIDFGMSAAPDGELTVVWRGIEPGGSPLQPDTLGRSYTVEGMPTDDEFVATPGAETSRFTPAVARHSSGERVVLWSGVAAEPGMLVPAELRGQRYDAQGEPLGDVFLVHDAEAGPQAFPAVAYAPDGGFLVTWQNGEPADAGGQNISARLYDPDGEAGSEFTVNEFIASSQRNPAVAAAADGRFLVVWDSTASQGSDTFQASIQARLFEADGSPVSGDFQVNTHTPLDQEKPAVVSRPDGGWLVVWEDAVQTIRGRLLAPDASPQGDDFVISAGFEGRLVEAPAVAVGPRGETVVVWQERGGEDALLDSSIRGRRFQLLDPGPCADSRYLCLGEDDRFQVGIEWENFAGETGFGRRVGGMVRTLESGFFYFFDPGNWEVLVKVLDGCEFNGHYWVFAAATTNVGYTLTVTDRIGGHDRVYRNTLGTLAPAIGDVEAFATCP